MWHASWCFFLPLWLLTNGEVGDGLSLAPAILPDGCSEAIATLRSCIDSLALLTPPVRAAGALAAGSLLLIPALGRASGLFRGLVFWRYAFPIYVDYRLTAHVLAQHPHLSVEERQHRWQALHEKHGPKILDFLVLLRGFYVKIGQVCSTRVDMFPRPWINSLEKLQGENPELVARPTELVKRIVQHDLGQRAKQIKSIEDVPLGAAATGQVHRAWLNDGRRVVVKVQYPEAARLYHQDFANVKLFCWLLQPEHLGYLQELEKQFSTEFDYRREAADLAEISGRFAEGSGNPYAGKVVIPKPVLELASRNVVVMEYLEGETFLSYARRRKRELERSSFLWALWCGWRLQRQLIAHLDLLIGVQGYQIFVDGVFNGDPHPGNVMMLRSGSLGLIDYGNVKRLVPTERALLGELMIALATEQRDIVVKSAQRLGFRTRHNNADALFRYAQLWFDRDDAQSMRLPGQAPITNVQVYLERLNALDPLITTPEAYLMAARNSFLMRGIGTHLGLQLRMAKRWRCFAEDAVLAAASGAGLGRGRAFADFSPRRLRRCVHS
mmetsp:Transcript_80964/g.156301  ORF Transcript_80964/g.156301 Transcript_80964/m.156301 type:complete len:554 (+) Transcript_80964:47-1708(+)